MDTLCHNQPPGARPVAPSTLKTACSSCSLRELCLPMEGLTAPELQQLDTLVEKRRAVPKGEALFRTGQPFEALYIVRTGFFKTVMAGENGHGQITGFQMSGEMLGLDGMSDEKHHCEATALEDSQVCIIPYEQLETLSHQMIELQRHFHRLMSREIVRENGLLASIGGLRAEERVANFLLDLTRRLRRRGFSASEFILRMTREDIGSYLGLKLETVSRAFSRLQEEGLLEVKHRQVSILNEKGLRDLAQKES